MTLGGFSRGKPRGRLFNSMIDRVANEMHHWIPYFIEYALVQLYLHTLHTYLDFTVELPRGQSLGHRPGQFVEVSVFGVGEAPISISSSPSRSNGKFELCVRKVGDVVQNHPEEAIAIVRSWLHQPA